MAMTATTTTTTVNVDSLHAAAVSAGKDVLKARRAFIKALKAAEDAKVWEARGFKSMGAYAVAVADEVLPKSAAKVEREMLALITVAFGASQSQAAKATGTSQATLSRKAKAAEGAEVEKEVKEVTGATKTTKVERTGGRAKGTPNKRTAAEKAAEVEKTDVVAKAAMAAVSELLKRSNEGDEAAATALAEIAARIAE